MYKTVACLEIGYQCRTEQHRHTCFLEQTSNTNNDNNNNNNNNETCCHQHQPTTDHAHNTPLLLFSPRLFSVSLHSLLAIMPTFASIGVHPRVVKKLAALDPSVETPLALLSRDPTGLARALQIPLQVVEQVRHSVAEALVSRTEAGRCALYVRSQLLLLAVHTDTWTPLSLVTGSMSAWEAIQHQQQEERQGQYRRICQDKADAATWTTLRLYESTIPLPYCQGLSNLLAFPPDTHVSIHSSNNDNDTLSLSQSESLSLPGCRFVASHN